MANIGPTLSSSPLCSPKKCTDSSCRLRKERGEDPIVVERGRRRRETAAASQHVVGCVLEPHWYRTYTYMYGKGM